MTLHPEPYSDADPAALHPLSDDGNLDVNDLLDVLRRRWKWVAAAALLSMIGGMIWQRGMPEYPVYTAEVMVQRLEEPTGLQALNLGGASSRSGGISAELEILRTDQILGQVVDSTGLRLTLPDNPELRSEVFEEVVVSPEAASREYVLEADGGQLVLRAAGQIVAEGPPDDLLTAPGLLFLVRRPAAIPAGGLPLFISTPERAIRLLDEAITVRQPDGTNLIRITYTGGDPVHAARVANAIAEAYRRQAGQRARQEARSRREFLAGRLQSVTDSLRMAQELLLDFQARSSTLNPQSEGEALSGLLLSAQEALRQEEDRVRSLESLLESLESGGPEGLRQLSLLDQDLLRGMDALSERLQDYETRRSNLLSVNRRTENAPEVLLLDSLITETEAELRLTVEEALRLGRQRASAARARVDDLQRQVGDVPERSVAFGRLEQRVAAIQRMQEMLAERFYEAQISEAVEEGNVQVVDPARPPTIPSGTAGNRIHPLLYFLLGGLLGFVGAVVQERLDNRVRTIQDVRKASGTEVLGLIPDLRDHTGGARSVIGINGSAAAESFRMLRTNVRFVRAEPVEVLVVTSAGPGEGKSMISANLAMALAQEGKSVLLVDADLRRPVQHTLFDVDRRPGLSDLLVGKAGRDAVRESARGIHVITAGTPVPNPAELTGSSAFSSFVDGVRERYDVVVIDTPPVLAVSDTSVIAPLVDGVILVARANQTPGGALASAAQQLRRARSSVLGVVMNDSDPHARTGYGGSYYGYGASHYLDDDGSQAGTLRGVVARVFSRGGA